MLVLLFLLSGVQLLLTDGIILFFTGYSSLGASLHVTRYKFSIRSQLMFWEGSAGDIVSSVPWE